MLSSNVQADDVGLGKTIQTIATIKAHAAGPTLIVTSKSAVNQWQAELSKEGLFPRVISSGHWFLNPFDEGDNDLVVVTHYDVLIAMVRKLSSSPKQQANTVLTHCYP